MQRLAAYLRAISDIVPKSSSVQGHAIFTPCRGRGRDPGRLLVVIKSNVIQKLRSLPLQEAARAVGVSATAFKYACCRLWLHRIATEGPTSAGQRRKGGIRRDHRCCRMAECIATAAARRQPVCTLWTPPDPSHSHTPAQRTLTSRWAAGHLQSWPQPSTAWSLCPHRRSWPGTILPS